MPWEPKPHSRPHPANCSGDFYVEDACCLTCGVPLHEAPEIFHWAGERGSNSCVVVKQPATPTEIDRTLAAMWSGEVNCIRYRGNDYYVGRRLVEAGLADLCDKAPPADAVPLTRSHVTFQPADKARFANIVELVENFVLHFRMRYEGRPSGFEAEATLVVASSNHASAKIGWMNATYHTVEFTEVEDHGWLAITLPCDARAGIGLSRVVDQWLRGDSLFKDVRWFSAEQWRAGGPYRPTVI